MRVPFTAFAVPSGFISGGNQGNRLAGWLLIVGLLLAGGCERRPASDSAKASAPDAPVPLNAYAGSAACAECHRAAHELWRQSHHALAERPVAPAQDAPAFRPAREFRDGSFTTRVEWAAAQPVVTTRGLAQTPAAVPVARVLGESPLRQFLVAADGGRWQTLEAAWDPHRAEWFNVFGAEDRRGGEWGHWTGRGMNWNSMCADCHNTALRKNYAPATDSYRTAMAEPGVGCEACHGPARAHVEWRRHHGSATTDPTLAKLKPEEMLDACGTCHSRRAELTGRFVPGDAFTDHFALATVDETANYFVDGQVREEDYEFASFLSSRMHAAGVRCGDCHQPHSAKTLLPGNALCQRCHAGGANGAPVIIPAAHTFHRADSTGSQCVNCHMPQTTFMQRHRRHDHGFTIPDPLLTEELGIPNACNRCHTDRDTAWTRTAAEKWYGGKLARPTRERARWIAAARRGDRSAVSPLLGLLRTNATPFWQGVAVRMLESWVHESSVEQAVRKLDSHTNSLVRANVVRALEPLATAGAGPARDTVTARLEDADRSVRVAAAWTLRSQLNLDSRAGRELRHSLEYQADQPVGQLRLGHFHASRGELPKALEHFRRAVAWDPNSPPLRRELAVALSQSGDAAGAVAELEAAAQLDPKEAEFRFLLALGYGEAERPERVQRELEAALRLNPNHARAAYNLGLLLHGRGDRERALTALLQAEAADSQDARIPYARATVHAELGQRDEARTAARRALELRPGWTGAEELVRSLRQ
jgi:Flp pilus assembly protein TadD